MGSFRYLILFSLIVATAGCHVYKSHGRRAFEDDSPDLIDPSDVTVQMISEECWLQSKEDRLADVQNGQSLSVQIIENPESEKFNLKVCRSEPQ